MARDRVKPGAAGAGCLAAKATQRAEPLREGLGCQIGGHLGIPHFPAQPREKRSRVPVVEGAEGVRIAPAGETKQLLVESLIVHHLFCSASGRSFVSGYASVATGRGATHSLRALATFTPEAGLRSQVGSNRCLSHSRGAAECASPEEAVLRTAPESEVRSATSGGSGRPVAPGRTEPPAEDARMEEPGGFEPGVFSRLWRLAGDASPEGAVLNTRARRGSC